MPDEIEALIRKMLVALGEDPERDGLKRTPQRVAQSMRFLTRGCEKSLQQILNDAIFEEKVDEMVVVRDIEVYSLCEHHLLPFFGKCHVAYLPAGKIVGLSKIPRIVDCFARRLQVQERLTAQIAEFLMEHLRPQGVGVVLEATHLCAVMRGVRKPGMVMTTSHVLGLFRANDKTRAEFLAHLQRPAPGA